MKLLTRLQMINWHYFSNEIIEFKKINFLTGSNSAGKSTIIDAIQAALMGETKSSRFNRAAGKKSERTFRSYLVGTLGEDVSSGVKALREGKDFTSYVAAEFYDDVKDEYFCLGVAADVFHDGSGERKRWFILEDKLPSRQFVIDGKSVESTAFLKWCRQNYAGNKFVSFDSVQDYNAKAARRLNVSRDKAFKLLRKAIAFEPISNIEDFITTNICDAEKNIDVVGMQENIRSYQMTEQQAQELEKQKEALSGICGKYDEITALRFKKKLQQFFIDYGYCRGEQDKLEQAQKTAAKYSDEIAEYHEKMEQLSKELVKLREEENALNAEKAQFLSSTGKDFLESEKKHIEKDIDTARNAEKKLINEVSVNSVRWIGKCDVIQAEINSDFVDALKRLLKRISRFSEQGIGEFSLKYFSEIKSAYENALCAVKPTLERYSDAKREKSRLKDRLSDEIAMLNKGIKPYKKNALDLKNAIKKGLSEKYHKEINVDFLADLIDVTDSEWKNAVEGFLGDKRMNIIVEPEYFMDAYYIYKRIHKELNVHEYSVVDLEKVFADTQTVKPNSLALTVTCGQKYVRAYIDYLLGRVIRCFDDEKIRDHRTSVTKDCMLYRGYAVSPINPFHYRNPYIGQKSVEEQKKQKTAELEICCAELAETGSHLRNLKAFCEAEWFLNQTFLDNVAAPAFDAYASLPGLREKLSDINARLSEIDTTRLEEIDRALKINDQKQGESRKQYENFLSLSSKASSEYGRLNGEVIPDLQNSIAQKEQALSEQYDEDFKTNNAIPEFQKGLLQYDSPKAFADAFVSRAGKTAMLIKNAETELINLRGNYNNIYHPTFNFSDTNTNDEYNAEYKRISEIELPAFAEKIALAKEMAMESFRDDFLNKLKNNIQDVIDRIKELNKALSMSSFGNNTYKFKFEPDPAYREYYEMIMAAEEGENLFGYEFREKYKDIIDDLFCQLDLGDGSDSAAEEAAYKLSSYSTYLTFDLLSIDNVSGMKESLSKTINAKSGGEIQTPFYVAMLASFAQIYNVNNADRQMDNTMRLIIFDEAFNKMDPERIAESIAMLRKFGLQAIICSPSDKAGDISPLCDRTLLVDKQNDGQGGYRSTVIEWTKELGDIV